MTQLFHKVDSKLFFMRGRGGAEAALKRRKQLVHKRRKEFRGFFFAYVGYLRNNHGPQNILARPPTFSCHLTPASPIYSF